MSEFIKAADMKKNIDFSGSLSGLKILTIDDITRFKEAVQKGKQKGWTYYFPFLYFYSLPSRRALLIGEDSGSICIYVLRDLDKESGARLQLYLPPTPFNETAFKNAIQRIYKYNGNGRARILRVDEKDTSLIENMVDLKVSTKLSDDEFIFDPLKYTDLSGSKFRNIRQQIGQINRLDNVKVVPYNKIYFKECMELYKTWKQVQRDKYDSITDGNYTKMCLLKFDEFSRNDLDGIVILIDNQLKAFGFYGAINDSIGNMFIGKSDHNIKGLQAFLKYKVLLKMQNFELANDSDGISKGLLESKQKFRPVMMHKIYNVLVTK